MHARKSQTHQKDKTRELQRKLYLAAKRNRNRRFHALYDRIYRLDILWRAWKEVRANRGSPGADGVTIEEIEDSGVEAFLQRLQTDLKEGRYRPQPVERVWIPKPDGRQRPLGIPTVRDRVVQQACRIVIEPIFEANFEDISFGFRPKRSAKQAAIEVKETLVRGWWVFDADIQGYFDHIDHELLMQLVGKRISDRRVLKLIGKWLKAGVLEEGKITSTQEGTPQGGVISPLLANIYLHVLDRTWATRHSQLGKLIRYADDFVAITRWKSQCDEAKKIVEATLKKLKLELHPTKSRIVEVKHEGFDFLGYHYSKTKSRITGKLIPFLWPSAKSMKKIRSQIKGHTERKGLKYPMEEMVKAVNPVIRGWANYFRIGNATNKLQALDRYVKYRFWKIYRARKHVRGWYGYERYLAWWEESGVEYFFQKGICGRVPCKL